MEIETTRTWTEIDLGALRANAKALRSALPAGSSLLGVVKADAYGHGAVRCAAADGGGGPK